MLLVLHVMMLQKNLENALGKVTVKNKTSDAFISNQNEKLKQFNHESNVTL